MCIRAARALITRRGLGGCNVPGHRINAVAEAEVDEGPGPDAPAFAESTPALRTPPGPLPPPVPLPECATGECRDSRSLNTVSRCSRDASKAPKNKME